MMLGEAELEDEVRETLSLTKQVELPGYLRNASDLKLKAKVLLHLSRYEDQPKVVLEAVAVDTIPVVSDIGEHREVLGPDYPFYVVPSATDIEVAQKIQLAQSASIQCLAYAKSKIAEQTVGRISEQCKTAILTL